MTVSAVTPTPAGSGPTASGAVVDAPPRRGGLRPQTLVLIVIALAPYDGLLMIARLPGVVEAWKEGLLAVAFGLAVLARPGQPRTPWPSWAVPLVLLAAWSGGSMLLHPSFQSVLGLKIGYAYLIATLTLLWSPLDHRDRDRLVTIMMTNGWITALVGIGQQFLGPEGLHQLGYEYNEVIRFTNGILRSFSTFNQPFAFALFLMVVLLIGLPVSLEERRRLRNRLFLWSTPVLLAAMSVAVVRAAFLGLVVGAIYLAVVRYRVLTHAVPAIPVLLLVLVLSGASTAMFSSSSLQERVTGWVSEVGGQSLSPLGQGIGSTGAAAERIEDADADATGAWLSDQGSVQRYQADNQYVKTLIELGPIGLWLFLCFLAMAVRDGHRTAIDTRRGADRHLSGSPGPESSDLGSRVAISRDMALAMGITAAMLGAISAGVVATYWEIFPVDVLFWVLLGVLPSLRYRSF